MEIFRELKVLELASVLAGPSVGQFFAELGAEVIKVENLNTDGDVTRTWKSAGENTDDRSAYFCSVNWGKRSVALDLNIDQHREAVQKLAMRSDIVIASYKPGDAEKLGVDYKTLSALNTRLIYGQVTGYGSDNPRVGYDAVIQAESGFMFMNGEPGGASLKMPVALMDVIAAHHLKEGILIALLNRNKTGRGDLVEVSLIQAAVASLVNQATNWLMTGNIPQKKGSSHPNIAPYGDLFRTADGVEILLAIGNEKQFHDLCVILEVSHLYFDPKFRTNTARVENRSELNTILQYQISQFYSDELIYKLHELKIPSGLIQNLKRVFEMKEAQEILLQGTDVTGVRNYAGLSLADKDLRKREILPPPHFGQHTSDILRELTD